MEPLASRGEASVELRLEEPAASLAGQRSLADALHLAETVVNKNALMPAQKMQQVIENPHKESHAVRSEEEDASHIANGIMVGLLRKVRHDVEMLRHYYTLLRFTCYAMFIVGVIALQLNVFNPNTNVTYNAARDSIFGFNLDLLQSDGPDDIRESVDDWQVFSEGVSKLTSRIFSPATCGDGICAFTEEMPRWQPGEYVRVDATDVATPRDADFLGCASDCGVQVTTNVTVSFYDPWKLAAHLALVEAIIASGELCDDDGNCFSISAWGGESPQAGWNLCHTLDREFGVESTTVCVFNGDFFVEGLPFRSIELDPDDDRFGQDVTLALYEGNWEVRYAFTGFTWTHPTSRDAWPVGFPAVRGRVCSRDDIANAPDNATCTDWGACPNAATCGCEFRDQAYVCDDDALPDARDHGPAPTEVYWPRFDEPDYDEDAFDIYAGIESVAKW